MNVLIGVRYEYVLEAVAVLVASIRKYALLCSRNEQESQCKKQAVVPCGVWKDRLQHTSTWSNPSVKWNYRRVDRASCVAVCQSQASQGNLIDA